MPKVSKLLDGFGVLALLGAGASIAASYWFLDAFLSVLFLQGFFSCLVCAVMLFGIARLLDIADFIVTDTRARRVRGERRGEARTQTLPQPNPSAISTEVLSDAA